MARARARELEARVDELGARLLDSEQRSAELLHTRARLGELELELQRAHAELDVVRGQLSLSEAAHQSAEHRLTCVNTSMSWRITAPLRSMKKRARTFGGR